MNPRKRSIIVGSAGLAILLVSILVRASAPVLSQVLQWVAIGIFLIAAVVEVRRKRI